MSHFPAVLCPIDFSEASRAAMVHAIAIADHFAARLVLMTVDDPLLAQAAETALSGSSLADETAGELRRFCADVLNRVGPGARKVEYVVRVGKPAPEILTVAGELDAELIVLSSHGRSGVRRLFFGSTTERVLRETTVPVLITPAAEATPASLSAISRQIHHVLAPLDLSAASMRQTRIASAIAAAISAPLILAHVLEPVFVPARVRMAIPGVDATRRGEAEDRLREIATELDDAAKTEALVLSGDPAEEIVKLAEARHARLIVMGLHSSELHGPRMGTVTYRVLCQTQALVLALPPVAQARSSASAMLTGVYA